MAYQFTFARMVQEGPLFSTPSPAFIVCGLFDDGHSDWCEVIFHCSFDLHFSNNMNVEHLSMCLLAICMSSWRNVCLGLLPICLLGCLDAVKHHELFVHFGY